MSAQRYEFELYHCNGGEMLVSDAGDYVSYEDYAALEARCAALAAENSRYSMSAGQADQRMSESKAVRSVLGFHEDGDDVSPSDLVEKIQSIFTELQILRSAHPQPLGPIMDSAIDAFNSAEMPETGMLNAFFILRDSIRIKNPSTDAFLAEVRESAVEDFCKLIDVYAKVEPEHFNPKFADLYAKIVNRVFSGAMDNPGVYSLETMSDWLERESEESRAYADISINHHAQLRQEAAK